MVFSVLAVFDLHASLGSVVWFIWSQVYGSFVLLHSFRLFLFLFLIFPWLLYNLLMPFPFPSKLELFDKRVRSCFPPLLYKVHGIPPSVCVFCVFFVNFVFLLCRAGLSLFLHTDWTKRKREGASQMCLMGRRARNHIYLYPRGGVERRN